MSRLSVASFLAHGHDFHLFSYSEIENAPEGTTIREGREILPETRIFPQPNGFARDSYAPFADCFRYQLLWEHGGR